MANQDKYTVRVDQLLHDHGARLIRQTKHKVFKLGNGAQVVMSSTPSDVNVSRQRLADLKRSIAVCPHVVSSQLPLECETPPALSRSRGQAPWPAREEADVVIPRLELGLSNSVQATREPIDVDTWVLLRYVVTSSELFWKLDPCGRTQVLRKVFSHLGMEVEAISVLLAAMPMETVEVLSADELFCKVWETAARKVRPALVVNGTTFIEADSFLRYKTRRKLLISNVFQMMGTELSKTVTLVLYPITQKIRQQFGIPRVAYQFERTESWTNPQLVRPALQEILEGCKAWEGRAA